jgi:hypothetical protein
VVELRRPLFGSQVTAQLVGPLGADVGQRFPAPECEGLLEEDGGLVVFGFACLGHEPPEPVQVHRVGVDTREVAAAEPLDLQSAAGQQAAQTGQVAVQRVSRAQRRALRSHAVDQLVDRHHPVRVGEQCRQHGPLPDRSEIHRLAVLMGFDRAQQPELHPCALPAATGPVRARHRIRPALSSRAQGFATVCAARW